MDKMGSMGRGRRSLSASRSSLKSISSIESIPSIPTEGFGPPRYRALVRSPDLVSVRVREKETDLMVRGERDLSAAALDSLRSERAALDDYLRGHPEFGSSLLPLGQRPSAPPVARAMAAAAALCGVGPLAAVAGALARRVGEALRPLSAEVIVENGGDNYLALTKERTVAVFAGEGHPLTGRLGLLVRPGDSPLGIAASSGRIGPSLSWGRAAAAVVAAESAELADAAATALGNRLTADEEGAWERAAGFLASIPGLRGSVAIVGERVQVWGRVELVETTR